MSLTVTPTVSKNDPSLMYFTLEGRKTLLETLVFYTSAEALDKLCPLAAAYLRAPYFERVTLLPTSKGDTIALKLKPGKKWDSLLSAGRADSTMALVYGKKIQQDMDGHSLLGAVPVQQKNSFATDAGNSSSDKDILEMRSYLQAHIPPIVTKHGGDIDVQSYDKDKKRLTMVFRGKCGSPTTCEGSQAATESIVTNQMAMEFPHLIRDIMVVKQP